jgi:putative metallohydrolase (TIGR04338 family)
VSRNDVNRSKFFKAERECFPDVWTTEPDFSTTQECQEFINQALNDPVFLRHYPQAKEIKVLVRPGRGARRINWWLEDTSAAIPKAYRRKYLLLHTAAHFLQPSDAPKHGYAFLKTYFALIQRELGKNTVEALKTSLKANGVAYRKPRAGTNTPEHSQMLRERMQAFNALRHKRSN